MGQAECYHYLFDAAIRLTQMGLDPADPLHGPLLQRAPAPPPPQPQPSFLLLDIEGTTTPIRFVTETLFPYALANVRSFLEASYETEETREDLSLLRAQVDKDRVDGRTDCQPIPGATADRSEVIRAAEAAVQSMIAEDRKVPALKQLQVGCRLPSSSSSKTEVAIAAGVRAISGERVTPGRRLWATCFPTWDPLSEGGTRRGRRCKPTTPPTTPSHSHHVIAAVWGPDVHLLKWEQGGSASHFRL